MNAEGVLAFHRELISIESVSGNESPIADFIRQWLARFDVKVERAGNNLFAVAGTNGPLVCLNTHLDTVPAAPGWTRNPFEAERADGRVYGLGSNDAKASVAAMVGAFLRLRAI